MYCTQKPGKQIGVVIVDEEVCVGQEQGLFKERCIRLVTEVYEV